MGNLPDPRGLGSGNPGATNVLRTGSKGAAIITLAGDVLKGLLPALLARTLEFNSPWLAAVAFAAFIGHLFPLYYRFRGGKGVATALGVTLGVHLLAGTLLICTWLLMAFLTRISSLSALISALVMPALIYWLTHSAWLGMTFLIISMLVIIRHRENISRILDGTESRLGNSR